jgi:acetylornithine deacetylase
MNHGTGMSTTRSRSILADLISHRTVTRQTNLALIEHVQALLAAHGIASTLVFDETGSKANLFASTGPAEVPGVVLSGHTDVVPVDGQAWTLDPFTLTQRDGRLYGRGSADMKGFIACAVHALVEASTMHLKRPLQLALSYDEEIGCVGVRRLLDLLEVAPVRPYLCIVGEPTLMRLATGHKGKTALHATCHGREGHSAQAPLTVNALHLGCDLVNELRLLQASISRQGARDEAYDVPYTTLHVGKFNGGVALNIVPNRCEIDFEIRNIANDDPNALVEVLKSAASRITAQAQTVVPEARVEIVEINSYPGLDTSRTEDAVDFVRSFHPDNEVLKLAFGTEGGLFSARLGVPVVVCGPGSITQAHKPDEFVEAAQLDQCDVFLAKLLGQLQAG